mmetsp:Transcript_90512/g.255510  ORF Transcript_90512/g.255510 Transcript_90512/m.255510 type:complete len:253 (-) Transcript_90512:479-1237(-)
MHVAGIDLVHRADAELPLAATLYCKVPRPLPPTIARAAAIAPRCPLGKLAIDVDVGARYADVAWLVLLREASHRFTALVGFHRHLPRAPGRAAETRCRALFPLRPSGPLAIDTRVATLRIASLYLPLVPWHAQLATALGRRGDVAGAHHRAATTCARTATPVGPLTPGAIDVLGARLQVRASSEFFEVAFERQPAMSGLNLHFPRSKLLAHTALGVALAPIAPQSDHSVVFPWHETWFRLRQRVVARGAAIH